MGKKGKKIVGWKKGKWWGGRKGGVGVEGRKGVVVLWRRWRIKSVKVIKKDKMRMLRME